MRTSDQIYQRVRWDPQFDPARFVLGVSRRGAEPKRVPLPAFVPGGDIPWHRVLFIEADGELVWDRSTGVDRLDATEAGRTCEPRRLRAPFFTAVTPYAWDPVLAGWRAAATPAAFDAPSGTKPGVRLLTWNTLWDRYDSDRIATSRRRPLLLTALRDADADVIALQEVEVALLAMLLSEPWVRSGYALGTDPSGKDVDVSGLLLLSRLPVREAGRHVLGPHKAVTAVTVQAPFGPLVIATTHLSSDHSHDGAARRKAELSLLADGLAGVDGDLVLLGDFNDGREGPEDPAGVLGMRDAWTEVHGPADRTPTFDPSVNPLAAVSSLSGRIARLDRILLRTEPTRRASSTVLRGNVPDPDGLHPSDHYGVQVELSTVADVVRRAETLPRAADPGDGTRVKQVLRTVAGALNGGAVHLVGSRRMGCALAGADVDLVAALPDTADPVDLTELRSRLTAAFPGSTRIRPVTGARVPGLRLHLATADGGVPGDLDVDLVVVGTGWLAPAQAVAQRAELGEAAAVALSAVSDAEAVLAAVGDRRAAFARLATEVKAWARVRGLDSAPFGGLPGLAWSVLAARTVRTADARLSPGELLREFFGGWAAWDWREPVGLGEAAPPTAPSAMTVLTPSAPVRSCTEQVSPATVQLLTQELYLAWDLLETATGTGADPWPGLLTPSPPQGRHLAWAILTVRAVDAASVDGSSVASEEALAGTLGRVRGRMRALLATLAEAGTPDAQAWPRPFESGPDAVRYAIGLGRTPPGPDLLARIAEQWSRGLPGTGLALAEPGTGPGQFTAVGQLAV